MALHPAPLSPDPEFGPGISRQLKEIMSVGPEFASEEALYDLRESVADALHQGKVDFEEHDSLLTSINAALDSLV